MVISGKSMGMPARASGLFGSLLGRGLALAFAFAAAQIPLFFMFGLSEGAFPIIITAFVIAHAVFVTAVTDFGIRRAAEGENADFELSGPACIGGLVLAALAMMPVWASYRFGDALPTDAISLGVPLLWAAAAALALPARLVGKLSGYRLQLQPMWQRLPLAIVFALPLLLPPALPLPEGECCGMFEGGLFILPAMAIYTGLYLFGASLMLALLSAAAVREADI